ncbi:DUF4097 family beta strand repeat-containing protein [Saccharothrix saharensis]|uniref:DUF4097 family beta strand repeat-containing protein n=1 Tax=Saccharothrix saharensis TaxID=571190 RepID=UPI003680410D
MQTFATPAPIAAVVHIPAGLVRLVATDRVDTAVEVRPADASKGRDVKAAEQTAVEYRDGVLRIESPTKNQILGPSGSVEVTVHLPTGSRVEGKAGAAGVHTAGRLGDVTFEGAHGAIAFDEVDSLRLTAHAGDVLVNRLGGPAEIDNRKGDIRIAEAVRGTVVARTEAGSISIAAAPGTSATLDAGTSYGRVHNTLVNAGDTATRLDIRATTSYGDITAHSLPGN